MACRHASRIPEMAGLPKREPGFFVLGFGGDIAKQGMNFNF